MKKVILISAVALLAGACGASRQAAWEQQTTAVTGNTADFAAEGDAAWAKRSNREDLLAAIGLYEKAVSADTTNLDVLTKLARAYYFLADGHTMDDPEQQIAIYDKGIVAAERALALDPAFKANAYKPEVLNAMDPKFAPAMYWAASNLGKWARLKGFMTLLKYKDTAKALIEAMAPKAPTYFYYGADRYWGSYNALAPSGTLEKSKEHYEKSMAAAPGMLSTKVLYADLYATKAQDKALYKRLLEEVLAADANADAEIAPENAVEQEKARRLLKPEVIEDRFAD